MPSRRASSLLVVSALVSLHAVPMRAEDASPVSRGPAAAGATDGRADFSFMHGRWRVHNRRLKESLVEREEWNEFDANLVCVPILNGLGNVDELRQLDGTPMGSAFRVFDVAKRIWSDYWVTARDGVLTEPLTGKFVNGRGEFVGPDTYRGKKVLVRYVWTDLSGKPRWEQSISADGGATWQINWVMVYERLSEPGVLPWPTDWRLVQSVMPTGARSSPAAPARGRLSRGTPHP
jgi:hypothetical protein